MDVRPLAAELASRLSGRWSLTELRASGFCETWRGQCDARRIFIKRVPSAAAAVLHAEADGLMALADSHSIRVPAVLDCWSDDGSAHTVLALEWLEFGRADSHFGERLGRALAMLHQAPPAAGAGCFGWTRDNMIGGTSQLNRWSSQGGSAGWIEFFRAQRLEPMRHAALRAGASRELIRETDRVIERLPQCFERGYEPRAALIHGDLWSGNWGMLGDGTPVIFDPAVSYSDAEAELAMMELFGAPPPGFWGAYREVAGLATDYGERRPLYQLYHLLNHVVLFGAAYESQALDRTREILGA